ncbi:MAG: hypothetical protein WC123_05710 [Bacilli bacterium]
MERFFCNPSYPIQFKNTSFFDGASLSGSISCEDKNFNSAKDLYDFFFQDSYKEQKQIDKSDK